MHKNKSTASKPQIKRFELVRYFTFASLAMFILVALALVYFQGQQRDFFQEVKREEGAFFKQVQEGFAKQQDEAARRDLLTIHEAGNVNLTRLFANALWDKDFAPFVAKAQQISIEECRAIADVMDPADGKMKPPPEKKKCYSEVGAKIKNIKGYSECRAIPDVMDPADGKMKPSAEKKNCYAEAGSKDFQGFGELNAKVYDAMKKSSVFKIKVFDLRGITVYSSEHSQLGEDKSGNAGWKGAAVDGKAKSELTFRDKFSAFEGVVEKRDLISSYLPVLQPGSDKIVGVFEVYSDVTPFLDQIKATSAKIKAAAEANQARVEQTAAISQEKEEAYGTQTLTIVLALLVALFATLYLIVRRAARIMAQQEAENQQAQQKLSQAEKMASLGQMVAGVAHQLNTPLAFTHSNVSMAIEALKGYALPLRVAESFAEKVKNAQGTEISMDVSQAQEEVRGLNKEDMDIDMPSEMLKDTLTGIDQMREMVENLRDFTRLDRTKTARVDLNKGLRNVVYIAKSVIPTTIEVVEAYDTLAQVECNLSQLNQVFLNLVNNAAQAIKGSGTITVKSSMQGNRVRIDVIDTGSGIPPDVLSRIWEPYFTTKEDSGGTGIGLSIAKTIVEEHGGEIDVRTEPGVGTTFSVYLPTVR